MTWLSALLAASLISACGGGGGGDATTSLPANPPPSPSVPTVPTTTSVTTLLPATGMDWSTTEGRPLTIAVRHADGSAAAGAAVRVFALSRSSPQDGAALAKAVPVSLLDSGVTDASGNARLGSRWPAHLTELLVVATDGDALGQATFAPATQAEAAVTLAR